MFHVVAGKKKEPTVVGVWVATASMLKAHTNRGGGGGGRAMTVLS